MVELKNLVKHYGVGDEPVKAVDGVTLSIARGELVALYGPSGSGKSTLINLIAALDDPDSGCVEVNGRDISALSYNASCEYRLNELGLVGQPSDILEGATALKNAALKLWVSNGKKAEQRMKPLLERLGLGNRLNQRGIHLSMGERQRVMIAQALSTEPALLLADEPTGYLDAERSREVLGLLTELCRERGTTVLIATHDPQAVSFADRAIELRDGKVCPLTLNRQPPS